MSDYSGKVGLQSVEHCSWWEAGFEDDVYVCACVVCVCVCVCVFVSAGCAHLDAFLSVFQGGWCSTDQDCTARVTGTAPEGFRTFCNMTRSKCDFDWVSALRRAVLVGSVLFCERVCHCL